MFDSKIGGIVWDFMLLWVLIYKKKDHTFEIGEIISKRDHGHKIG